MKDQNTVQNTNNKFQQDIMFSGNQMPQQNSSTAVSFNNEDGIKRTMISGLQKKSNPRLFIL